MRSARTILSIFLTAAITLTACSPEEPEFPQPRTVLVQSVGLSSDTGRRFSGQLQAADRSDLAFEVGGAVQSINVELGDSFEAGEILAELNDRSLVLELSAAQASLADAEATLVDSRLDYERRSSLQGTGAIAQSEIDRAKAVFDRARAQVQARQADADRSRERVSDARLVAPFDGEVVERLAEPSEVVAGGAPILRIVGTESNLEAVVVVSGSARRELTSGQSAQIVLLAQNSRVLGSITEIGAQANAVGLFPITIALQEHPEDARPGESIETIFLATDDSAKVQIPLTAYVPTGLGEGTVYVVVEDSGSQRLAARTIQLGALGDHGVQVVSGLNAGDVVVTKGVELLSDGEVVLTAGTGIDRYNR